MTETSPSSVALARTSIAAVLFFAFVMYVAFPFIQPELDPLHRYGSEYAVGRMGWLMKLAFFVWGGGLLAHSLAMARALDRRARSVTAIALFAVGGLGVFLAGVYDSDLQIRNENPPPPWIEGEPSREQQLHAAAGMVGLLSLMIGAGFATRRLRLAGRLRSGYRSLRWWSWLTPVAFVAFATVFASRGLAGLGQRIFLLSMFAWQVVAARGLASGAFSQTRPAPSTTSGGRTPPSARDTRA